jgi:TPR repeat protein
VTTRFRTRVRLPPPPPLYRLITSTHIQRLQSNGAFCCIYSIYASLGFHYDTGLGVPQADVEAVRWHRLAADQGHASAQSSLGHIYDNGRGVPQDYVEAHKWLNLAASRATGDFQKRWFPEARDTLAAKMTPAQIAEAQKLAREWQAAFDARQE